VSRGQRAKEQGRPFRASKEQPLAPVRASHLHMREVDSAELGQTAAAALKTTGSRSGAVVLEIYNCTDRVRGAEAKGSWICTVH
jgi:hypothetical protein